jgi:hypothetical protein
MNTQKQIDDKRVAEALITALAANEPSVLLLVIAGLLGRLTVDVGPIKLSTWTYAMADAIATARVSQ